MKIEFYLERYQQQHNNKQKLKTMQYFTECKTTDEAKNLFRKLCLKMHPDKGGDHNEFIKMYEQFKKFKPKQESKNDENFNAEKFYNIIQHFANFEGVILNFVGSFIWIEGNTHQYKDELKKIILEGFKPIKWASVKKSWFFSPLDYQKKSGKATDLELLKVKYGCNTFTTKGQLKIS